MNALLMPFRQLVDRKLWPLAVLLVAALAAVPILMASEEEPAPVAPTASAGTAAASEQSGVTQPIVTLGDATEREGSRKVLGARKNPFKPAVKAKKAAATTTASVPSASVTAPAASSGGGGSTSSSGIGATAPRPPLVRVSPVAPVAPPKTYELFRLKIRFGSTASADLVSRSVKRLTALPRVSDPVVLYLGLRKDHRTAVFLVAANTVVVGDGRCVPSPTDCKNLELKKGQTAFIDVLDASGASTAQYQLDHVKVLRRTTTDASVARDWRHEIAKGGRVALRASFPRINGWTYDVKAGVLVAPPKD